MTTTELRNYERMALAFEDANHKWNQRHTATTRLELLYNHSNVHTALVANGYNISKTDSRLYIKDCQLYKVAWVHRNNFGQITYIDLVEF